MGSKQFQTFVQLGAESRGNSESYIFAWILSWIGSICTKSIGVISRIDSFPWKATWVLNWIVSKLFARWFLLFDFWLFDYLFYYMWFLFYQYLSMQKTPVLSANGPCNTARWNTSFRSNEVESYPCLVHALLTAGIPTDDGWLQTLFALWSLDLIYWRCHTFISPHVRQSGDDNYRASWRRAGRV